MRRLISLVGVAALLLCLPMAGAWAEELERDAEIKELKERLEKLERQAGGEKDEGGVLSKIDISGFVTAVAQGSSGNGGGDDLGGNVSADLYISARPTEAGTVGLHFDMCRGSGLSGLPRTGFETGRFASTLLGGPNADLEYNSDIPHLVEAWYEHALLDEKVVFTFGLLDPTVYFDANAFANDERLQFLADAFVNNPGIDWGGDANFYGPGLRLTVAPAEWLDLSVGAFATKSVATIAEEQDEVLGFDNEFDKPMTIVEVNFKPNLLGREGNYRFYGWYNANVTRFNVDGEPVKSSWGGGGSFDQMLTDRLGAFLRWSKQDPAVRQLDFHVSGGLSATGAIPARPNDVAAIGYAVGWASDQFRRSGHCDGTEKTEQWLEAYYSVAVTQHFYLTPDIQYVINPCLDDDSFVILGLRANATF